MSDHPMKDDCIFCRIIAGEARAAVIAETNEVMAIMDAYPATRGHTLILPRGHYETIHQLPIELLSACAEFSQKIAQAIAATIHPDGIALHQYNGAAAGQTVLHYHQHIIPRWHGQRSQGHGSTPADFDELEELAAEIRDHLE